MTADGVLRLTSLAVSSRTVWCQCCPARARSISARIGLSRSSADVAPLAFGEVDAEAVANSGSRALSWSTVTLLPPPSGVIHSVNSGTRPGFHAQAIEPGRRSRVEGLVTAGSLSD